MFGPVAGSTIENVHFIKNIENKRRTACVMSGARKHNHAVLEAVKTTLPRPYVLGFEFYRMDFKPHDSLGRFHVPPGGDSFKETRST